MKCITCKQKTALCAFAGEKNAMYCGTCKKEGMIDVKHSKCIICNIRIPHYGLPTDKKAQYCSICKTQNMVDIKHPKCIVCKLKYPVFGYLNDKANHCSTCKKNGMIDICCPKCIVCKAIRPYYGMPDDEKPKYCYKCKKDGMINSKKRVCVQCKIKSPTYGIIPNSAPKYCLNCKTDDMIDIKHLKNKCKSEWCSTRASNKYEGYCTYCFMHLFPNKPMARNYKTKEKAVQQYIKEQFPDIDMTTDKQIQDGCSRKRPDILIDLGYQIIIVEIDENQHINYDCSCENKRIMQLSQDVGHRPIVFIRFNPDEYILDNNKITSCWAMNKHGISSIKKTKITEWNERLQCLKTTINYWLIPANITEKLIEVIELYYDN